MFRTRYTDRGYGAQVTRVLHARRRGCLLGTPLLLYSVNRDLIQSDR